MGNKGKSFNLKLSELVKTSQAKKRLEINNMYIIDLFQY